MNKQRDFIRDDMQIERYFEDIKTNEKLFSVSHKSARSMIDVLFPNGVHDNNMSSVNVIPEEAGTPGKCCRSLVVAISEKDSLNTRMLEIIRHCAVKCKNYTTKVHIITPKWSSNVWCNYEGDFRDMKIAVYLHQLGVPTPRIRLS